MSRVLTTSLIEKDHPPMSFLFQGNFKLQIENEDPILNSQSIEADALVERSDHLLS